METFAVMLTGCGSHNRFHLVSWTMSGEAGATVPEGKRMRLRYAGVCRECGTCIDAGTQAFYNRDSKTVSCVECDEGSIARPSVKSPEADSGLTAVVADPSKVDAEPAERPPFSEGEAGASARKEFERRHEVREKRVRERFPRAGGLILAFSGEPQSTRAWDVGAVGEEKLGGMLTGMAGRLLRVLHDRRIPGTRANIDHLVVCPRGMFVIDAKRYKGRRPQLRVEGGLLRPRVEKLTVGGRDSTKLVDGVLKQVHVVSAALDGPQVQGILVFVDADWPLVGGAFATRGVPVAWPKRMAKLLVADGPYDEREIERIHRNLAGAFPAH